MERYNKYLETFNSENTKNAALSTLKKIEKYMIMREIGDIEDMDNLAVDDFIKKEFNGKSNTTLANLVSKLKNIFAFYNNSEATSHLNLTYVKTLVETSGANYLEPSRVYNFTEELLNYQDKVLVMLVYMGLYDDNFETIRNLKISQIKPYEIRLRSGEVIMLNEYCNNIIQNAIKEEAMEKYIVAENRTSKPYEINTDSEYLIRSKKRKNGADILPSTTLKKKFEAFSHYTGVKVTPMSLHHSKTLYNLVKLEYETNNGLDINQLELKNILKEDGVKGTIEQLNMSKKLMKMKIISDIIEGKDFFIMKN